MADQNFLINSIAPVGSGRFYTTINTDQGNFIYVPQEFVYTGLRQGDNQFVDPSFLNKNYLETLKPIRLDADNLTGELKNAGYKDPTLGVLIKQEDWNKFDPDTKSVTYYSAVGKFSGNVNGIGEKDGNLVYTFAGANGSNYGIIDKAGTPTETTITPGKSRFGGVLGDIANSINNLVAGVPFLPEVIGIATQNPYLYGSLKASQTAGQGGGLEDVLKAGIISGGTMALAQNLLSGTEAFGGEVETQPGGFYGQPAPEPVLPPTDYSLLGGATPPPQPEGMGGGTGITEGASGQGFQQQTSPNIGSLGGGQGLTIPVEGGTVGQLGFTPSNAVPVLGSPGSFINNPEVLGQPVIAQGTTSGPISIQDALRGANLLRSLNQTPQMQTPNLLGQAQKQLNQNAGVDYTSLLQLLSNKANTAGLLGTQFRPQSLNLTSLLG